MSSFHHRFYNQNRLVKVIALLAPALTVSTTAYSSDPANMLRPHEADPHVVFTSPPAPEVIAKMLFPPKYRSANIYSDAIENHQTRLFSMMINFQFDSASILPESEPMLQALGEMMGIQSVANRSLVVEGHTDAIGDHAYNQALSEQRARAIKQYLVENFGIAASRLTAVGKGERELYIADKPTAAINRRATFRPADSSISN